MTRPGRTHTHTQAPTCMAYARTGCTTGLFISSRLLGSILALLLLYLYTLTLYTTGRTRAHKHTNRRESMIITTKDRKRPFKFLRSFSWDVRLCITLISSRTGPGYLLLFIFLRPFSIQTVLYSFADLLLRNGPKQKKSKKNSDCVR